MTRTALRRTVLVLLAAIVGGCVGTPTPDASLGPSYSPAPPSRTAAASAASLAPSATPATPSPSAALAPSPPAATPSLEAGDPIVAATLAVIEAGTVRYEMQATVVRAPIMRDPATGRGKVSFGEPRQFWVSRDEQVDIEMQANDAIVDGDRVYLRSSGDPLPQNTWTLYTIERKEVFDSLIIGNYGDPRLILAPLLGASTAREAGTDTIDGRTATRFETDVDPDAALDRLPAHLVEPFKEQLGTVRKSDVRYWEDMEVWLGPDGELLRMRFHIRTATGDVDLLMTYDFDGVGEPITFEPGPDQEVLTPEEARELYRDLAASPSPSASRP